MKFSTILATTLLATGATAQLSATNPLQLIQYLEYLLTPSCRNTVDTLFGSNSTSSISQCLNAKGAIAILGSNSTSIIPGVNTYLQSICSSPACQPSVINNVTNQILTNCASDLSNFGISNQTVSIITGAYPTAREVACLSTRNSTLVPAAYRNSTANSTLCPTALLGDLESYLGAPLSTSYLTSLILGANATAYRQITGIAQNATLLKGFACNDCVQGSVDVILENYPQLNNVTIQFSPAAINNYTSLNLTTSNNRFTIPSLYQGVCGLPVGYNISLPSTLNSTAYNTTVGPNVTRSSSTATGAASSTVTVKKRFAKWE